MAQHDQVIDNASGLAVRTDINAALAALFSSNSGTVEPTVKVAGQLWFDTTTAPGTIKIRNSANNAWITLGVLSAVDMSVGFRSGPDRWVINDSVNLTGRDLLVMDDTGLLKIQDKLSMVEVDGSVRTHFLTGIGADPGSLYCVVYNSTGVEVNRWWLTTTGFFLSAGSFKFNPAGGVLRGNISAELVAAAGRLDLQTYSNAPALDGSAVLSPSGLALNLVGDFYISRSGFMRANFGWDATMGAYVRSRDAAGAIINEMGLLNNGLSIKAGAYRFEEGAVLRGSAAVERSVAAGRLDLRSNNNAGAEDGYLSVSPNGGGLSYGDYFLWRSGVMRANFGIDLTNGAYLRYRDAAGAVANDMYLNALGVRLQVGGYRMETAGVLRGMLSTEKSAAAGRGQWDTFSNAAVLDGQAVLNNNGLALPLTGDFFIYRSGFQRANFGWDATNAAYIRMRDAAGLLTTELGLGAAIATIRQTGTDYRYRVLDSTSIERGSWGVDIANSGVYIDARDAAGAVAGRLDVNAAGAKVSYTGQSNKKIFDTGWFPDPGAGGGNQTDFPVGTDLFFHSTDGAIVNRNGACTVRILTDGNFRFYQLSGGTNVVALSGSWVSCGAQQIGSNPWQGIARRIA